MIRSYIILSDLIYLTFICITLLTEKCPSQRDEQVKAAC